MVVVSVVCVVFKSDIPMKNDEDGNDDVIVATVVVVVVVVVVLGSCGIGSVMTTSAGDGIRNIVSISRCWEWLGTFVHSNKKRSQ